MTAGAAPEPPAPPPAAGELFGARLPMAARYVELLATAGVERGLLGPREIDRLWERHVLNCAVVGELLSSTEPLIDVGTGAGLPGMVLAVRYPALPVTLIEPLARRVAFLQEAIADLGLDNVTICRGRADEFAGRLTAPVATARAVAPLDRLARWALPLLSPAGRLLAIKGRSAEAEIAAHGPAVRRLGGRGVRVTTCGIGVVDPPTTVVVVERPTNRPADGRADGPIDRRRDRKGSR